MAALTVTYEVNDDLDLTLLDPLEVAADLLDGFSDYAHAIEPVEAEWGN